MRNHGVVRVYSETVKCPTMVSKCRDWVWSCLVCSGKGPESSWYTYPTHGMALESALRHVEKEHRV